ncbi:putative transcriptional regulator [Halomicrobium zhouii]|uniref:Putative transcriptional regulator n=1 Tax=Halomicrobium zhouii TaxID=767519 RepID=A0A1I6LZ43_9EURY|nr:MarR family transcriptional regulator [Halomicrobium zhouii]SFS08741.1 putative transcriptional regulator [Halomicrobium zhouii]
MAKDATSGTSASVLRNKRNATQYQILVQIADRQPAVSQQEIADVIGITSQAVSNYLQDLVEREYVRKLGRGRYEVTKEGVDWLISHTTELREFVDHVSDDVVGQVDIDAAIATGEIEEGERVSLSMRDGILHATPGAAGSATGVAATDAESGEDVGVTDFDGVVDYDYGAVTIVSVPRIEDGGSEMVDGDAIVAFADDHDLVAVAGNEAIVAARRAGLSIDIRFASTDAVREAATKGLDVLLVATADRLSSHTDSLRDQNVSYEVRDVPDDGE